MEDLPETVQWNFHSRFVRKHLRIQRLADAGDLDALVKIAEKAYSHWEYAAENPRHAMSSYGLAQLEVASEGKAAADALADAGERGLAAIQRQAALQHGSVKPWLIYAASRNPTHEATDWLEDYAKRDRGHEPCSWAAFALAQRGKAGEEALRRLANSSREVEKMAGQTWLHSEWAPLQHFTDWPEVKVGSLPNELP